MKKTTILSLFFITFALASCDDGRIYEEETIVPEEGCVVRVTGDITGADSWASAYSVVVAGFERGSNYAIITKTVPVNGTTDMVMAGVSEEVEQIELCVINRLRKRIVSFATYECTTTAGDTIRIDVGQREVGMYATIQEQLFNPTCANCHGGSTSAAAGLILTEGRSHDALVGKASTLYPDSLLVSPGDAEASILYQALTTDLSTAWRYDHTREVLDDEWKSLLKHWIEGGAKN